MGASPNGARADADASPNVSRDDAEALPKGSRADAGTDADGGPEADRTVPLGWVVSVESGRTRTFCEACAREHLRSIEAKLDSDWW
jgi:hypothetical protein